ncbi:MULTISPECIES: amino acid adenylation domain-containing protein [Streptomyces]|uniref:amino acid adenylation domain-containing protein n=1 Tax=Streptomyces TaxID=1883 RepID=UPI000A9156F2|nr:MULTISPECIES: amino acid adenylation domain-containing protein [Streptomyces]
MSADGERAATTLHGLVERQARRAPEAVAVRCGEQELTYRELDERADRLAALLAERGLAPGGRAAVALGRGTAVYVALLAVLKAGAAYVPLEPTAPDALLRHVLADAAPDVVVTEEGHRVRLADAGGAQLVCVDTAAPATAPAPFAPPETGPEDLACVFYTSGSTGLPTGALVEHRNLLAAYAGWREVYGLSAGDRILQTASPEFDVFSADWVRALCSGATLVVAPADLTLDRSADLVLLPELVAAERITVLELNVRLARRLTELLARTGRALPGVRLLTVGAEKWYLDEQLGLQRLLGEGTRVLNVYGLAEATVDSTYFDAQGTAAAEGAGRVSLVGRPFPGTRVYVLGPSGAPAKPGMTGEIAIAGAGLTRGYLNRPADTARRFVRADFDPDGRVLLTGDLGVLRADGVLEFTARAATVVGPLGAERPTTVLARVRAAVRAEGVLRGHPAVREAVVVEVEPAPGQRQLVGYAVTAPNTDGADGWSLSQHLKAELKGRSTPTAVIPVPELPRTRAGKLDRAALPLPAPPEHAAPRSAKAGGGKGGRRSGGKAGGGSFDDAGFGRSCAAVACTVLFAGCAWAMTSVLFPGSTDLAAVPTPYRGFFELLYLCENLAFGAGIVYLCTGYEAVLRQGRPYRLSALTHAAITWLLVNWWPQDNLYRLTEADDWPREAAMVFAFNVPLMLAALVVVRFMLWRPPVGTAGTGGKGRTGGTG